jgi:hypothetical protein
MANVDVFTHDLGAVTGEKLRLLPPVAPGPPDLDGRVVSNQIMALGLYAPEAEVGAESLQVISADLQPRFLPIELALLSAKLSLDCRINGLSLMPCSTMMGLFILNTSFDLHLASQAHLLAFFNLRTSSRAGAVVTSQPERLSTMLLPGQHSCSGGVADAPGVTVQAHAPGSAASALNCRRSSYFSVLWAPDKQCALFLSFD